MSNSERSAVLRRADAQARIPGPSGEHFANVLQRGTLRLLLSRPVEPNKQVPHSQDEIYLIVQGSGVLFHDGKRDLFGPGDAMFVAAGTEHYFEDFTEDLAVWVVFYGPAGGETAQ